MKPLIYTLTLITLIAAFIGGFWFGRVKPNEMSQPLRLEQILSIKELHLVKHVYQDLFFLHKKNNTSKSIRAIVQIPVEITAYLNLKEIQIIYDRDSIRQVILPRAYLNDPHYKIDQMRIRETHRMQIHVGKDLYLEVGNYLSAILKERIDTVRNLAAANRILTQAETEGKAYIEDLLKAAGRPDVIVMFADKVTNNQVALVNEHPKKRNSVSAHANPEVVSFGFIPLVGNQ